MGRLRVCADKSFRELVLFTPQHRHAVAIEPYTCSADAANFWARGIDSGWLVLDPAALGRVGRVPLGAEGTVSAECCVEM